jgi:sister-chromatid-cohesion protein PDS5
MKYCNDSELKPWCNFICLIHLSRSLPPKRKGQPKNKRRKTAGGIKSVVGSSGTGGNDSDSYSSLAHSDMDKDVESGTIV